MNKKYIIPGIAVLGILAISAGVVSSAYAASNNSNARNLNNKGQRIELTEAQKTEMQAKHDAVKAALVAGDYAAWVKAETAINADCPMFKKINESNFSKYVEAFKLREQANTIMKDLGIEQGGGMGMGMKGMGPDGGCAAKAGKGMGKGMGMGKGLGLHNQAVENAASVK